MSKNDQRLSGVKEISSYSERPWEVIHQWVREKKFPARKIDGRWESFKGMIDKWFEDQIRGVISQ